jgi:hypothetical protein
MTALNFPDSPTNGEVYEGYIYDSSDNVWNRLPEAPGINLENLGNVSGTPTAGDSLIYDGSNWLNTPQKNRNLLHNGAMQVHQRGTSATGITSSGYYTADRYQTSAGFSGQGTWTQTIESDAPTGSGFRKSLKMLCTTAAVTPDAGAAISVDQKLEGQDVQIIKKGTSAAEQLTLSFWVKSNVTGTYAITAFDGDNTRAISVSYAVGGSGVWEKKTVTFPADTTGAFDNDSANSLQFRWWLVAGSDRTSGTLQTSWATTVNANLAVGQTNLAAATNNYWQITGVQLEVGPVATPFEFKSYGQELAECQRYYYQVTNTSSGGRPVANVAYYSTTTAYGVLLFPTTMRATPSVSFTNVTGWRIFSSGVARNSTDTAVNNSSENGSTIVFTTSSATAGNAGWAESLGGVTASINFSSEL